jgi:signal transduction histidine kinase
MFKRLRNRLLLLNMAMVSVVMIAAFAVVYFTTYTNIQKETRSRLAAVPTLSGVVYSSADSGADIKIVLRVPADRSLSFTVWVDSSGQVMNVLSHVDMPLETYHAMAKMAWDNRKPTGAMSLESRKWQYSISPLDNKRIVQGSGDVVYNGDGQYQIAFLDITDASKTLTQLLVTFVSVGIAVLFFLFAVSLHFANCSIRPVEDSWRKQKQFVADASHELKTPLAIIGANADALLANAEETVKSQRKWVDYIHAEAVRMGRLVNDMLYLTKVEDAGEDRVPLDLSATVLNVIASMEAVMFERGIHLTQSIEPGVIVQGDGERIERAVLALLDNAAKYTGDHGSVDVTLRRLRNQAVFSIRNSGEGIPPEKLPKVFDRFYRGDPSRSHKTRGYGLGLSIAKAIIERAGGSIYAQSAEESTTFTFTLRAH